MNRKKWYSIIPIYAIPTTWMIWAVLLHLNSIRSYIICLIVSLIVYLLLDYIFPPYIEEEETEVILPLPTESDPSTDVGWESLIALTERQIISMRDTPLSESIKEISKNVKEANLAIIANPKRKDSKYLREFEIYYRNYSRDLLPDYLVCAKSAHPGRNMKEIMRLIEEQFTELAEVSKLLLENIYQWEVYPIRGGSEALKVAFDHLKSKSDFDIPSVDMSRDGII